MQYIKYEEKADPVRVLRCDTAVVGSGAAGYNAADTLWQLGQRDILLLTERRNAGTSRNTGSDKQTYYKLTLCGEEPDSVRQMAETLFEGRCVDGDIALCEAALSAQCFLKLVQLGVPFPRNRYGEYVGYKTDHDPKRRATSAGPYTSRQMTEKLEQSVLEKQVPLYDHLQVIKILRNETGILGLLCLDLAAKHKDCFVLVQCRNVIYATGGPSGMYADSVYPHSQSGSTGLALEAGVIGKNLTEWQYGLASVNPRWNVSGTYMQVLPRVFSAEADGSDEREFLLDFFQSPSDMMSMLFLKGYQWPFDVRKVENGSSIIDILVYLETQKGRKVYLDYRKNPNGEAFSFAGIHAEARSYLEKAGACFGTPIERLQHMNQPAVDFFRDRGIDLATQPLEIALCAQHNNGGLGIDCWWQTNVPGLFAVGEVAASHGVYRPGGSALNAGQVGSLRAAQYIAAHRAEQLRDGFEEAARQAVLEAAHLTEQILSNDSNLHSVSCKAQRAMSRYGAAFRDPEQIERYLDDVRKILTDFSSIVRIANVSELGNVFRLRDMLICQMAYLCAMVDYAKNNGKSRGSALYYDPKGKKPFKLLPKQFTYSLEDDENPFVQEVALQGQSCRISWRPVRPIPQEDDFFENVWRSFRENGNVN